MYQYSRLHIQDPFFSLIISEQRNSYIAKTTWKHIKQSYRTFPLSQSLGHFFIAKPTFLFPGILYALTVAIPNLGTSNIQRKRKKEHTQVLTTKLNGLVPTKGLYPSYITNEIVMTSLSVAKLSNSEKALRSMSLCPGLSP